MKTKRFYPLCVAACTILLSLTVSCGGDSKEKTDAEQLKAIQEASHEELATAIADRDSLLGLVNDINADIQQIKEIENILSIPVQSGETNSQRDELQANLQAIRAALEDRRLRLEQLERKLNESRLTNRQMQETIESLRQQIDDQAVEIESLTAQLEEANKQIGELNQQVDSLNSTVSDVTAARDAAQDKSQQLEQELNTVYYVVAGKDELKKYNIVEGGGFLKKTKTMQGNFDIDIFQAADKRVLKTIKIKSKKAKVLTQQPADTYILEKGADGNMVLTITNPKAFWAVTDFLVVQTD